MLPFDDIQVGSEDEVCDFVVDLLRLEHHHVAIKLMIECVRLPHLSARSFSKLCEALKDGPALVSCHQGTPPQVLPFSSIQGSGEK